MISISFISFITLIAVSFLEVRGIIFRTLVIVRSTVLSLHETINIRLWSRGRRPIVFNSILADGSLAFSIPVIISIICFEDFI